MVYTLERQLVQFYVLWGIPAVPSGPSFVVIIHSSQNNGRTTLHPAKIRFVLHSREGVCVFGQGMEVYGGCLRAPSLLGSYQMSAKGWENAGWHSSV